MKKENNIYKEYFNKYANPMIVRSILSQIMYTADRLIAGLFIGAGALAATTLISPIIFIAAAFASLFISGMGAYAGLLIGRGENGKAGRLASGILLVMTGLGFLILIPSIVFSGEIARFLGAEGEFFLMASSYLKIIAISLPMLLLGRGLDVLILNDESPKYSFRLNMVGSLSNLALNFIAVALLDLGIEGLAWATVISSSIELLGGIYYFMKKSVKIHLGKPEIRWSSLFRVLYNGLSDFAMMLVEAVMVFIVNRAFLLFLTEEHFKAYAAVNVIVILFYSIYLGAIMGLQPVLSQMMGRGDFSYLKKVLGYSVKKTMIYGLAVYLLLIPFIEPILKLFVQSEAVLAYGKFFYLTIGAATLFSNYPLQTSIFYTAINRPLESAAISLLRTLILIPIFSFLFINLFLSSGVAMGLVLSDLCLMALLFFFMKNQDLSKVRILN